MSKRSKRKARARKLAKLHKQQSHRWTAKRQTKINKLARPRACPARIIEGYAREMREKPTPAEAALKQLLDETMPRLGLAFADQVVIGRRIADFVITPQRIIVEVDGPYHQFIGEQDRRRTRELTARGYRVIRFSNDEVLDAPHHVVAEVLRACGSAYEMADDAYIPDDLEQIAA